MVNQTVKDHNSALLGLAKIKKSVANLVENNIKV